MEKSYLFSTTFNNVVFSGRNKAYGAYALRRQYSRHLAIATILATVTFSGALVTPLLKTLLFGEQVKYEKPVYDLVIPIDILPPPVVEKPKEIKVPVVTPAQPVKTAAYTSTKIVPDDSPEPVTELASQEELKTANIGTKNMDGVAPEVPATTITVAPPAGIDAGTGTTDSDEPFITVDQMPEFTGGEKALFAFLSNNINYPARARQAGAEGLVVVTFVVAANGSIQNVEVLKGLGFGTEEEAIRVIRKMPQWTPGRQNGRAVPVRYTLPIRFSLK
ncbi:energy transducer TonB [Pontibacter sp. 172403-2]|uniref:energy transducer TonB n=1 Tax=Pontibacter rufus TaxID=2791028 RepID=UPI0018AFD396|nr:energy transducer TonB [Pontibacter sp. 172403-2]MBF9255253.1 energy transducer TonB [Pontibacter sp. 172403-2]